LLVIAGFVVGVPVALAASRLVSSRLFGLVAADPVTFGLAAAVLCTVAVVAALVPAQRASRVDPVAALRCE
jgi:ABC-type antimicrobial peptide transport system permease subunit